MAIHIFFDLLLVSLKLLPKEVIDDMMNDDKGFDVKGVELGFHGALPW